MPPPEELARQEIDALLPSTELYNRSSGGPREKNESLEDSANLPDPGVIAADIVEDLQAALAQFAEIANDLKK